MRKKRRATRYCLLLLIVVVIWRVLGAPITLEHWRGLETPLWQARTLLPVRIARVLAEWTMIAPGETAQKDALLSLIEGASAERGETVAVFIEDVGLTDMPLEQYVLGVVAAEMPASYHLEALKAQAVAARTRAVRQMLDKGCERCQGADVCTDSGHCQGFLTLGQCQKLWQGELGGYQSRISQAVDQTRGVTLCYQGQPIEVLYHAISGGRTEDAQTVFSQAQPYLVSVESRGEEGARGYSQTLTMTREEAAARLCEHFPDCGATAGNLEEMLRIHKYLESGRVDTLWLGQQQIKASELRSALGLRSTWFELRFTENEIHFDQKGYGHGVGMSQAGANAMAAEGYDYAEILKHYYQETELVSANALINR